MFLLLFLPSFVHRFPAMFNTHCSKDSRHLSDEEKLELILSARVHLKDISIQSRTALTQEEPNYGGVVGHFCSLNWNLHKEDPSKCKW